MSSGFSPTVIVKTFESDIAYWSQHSALFFARLTPDLPQEVWWLSCAVLLILGFTALVDAFKARVPDAPILMGLLLVVTMLGYYEGWEFAGKRLGAGIAVAVALWGLNEMYYIVRKCDAIGMGDAKWSALAVTAFTLKPVAWAWVVGAWLGLLWFTVVWIPRLLHRALSSSVPAYKPRYIHFAPFLFTGLLASLYWFNLR